MPGGSHLQYKEKVLRHEEIVLVQYKKGTSVVERQGVSFEGKLAV